MTTDSKTAREVAAQAAESVPPDRRKFLMTGAVLGAGAAFARHGLAAGTAPGRAAGSGGITTRTWPAGLSGGPSKADWAKLRAQLSTRKLSLPGERSYPLDKQLYDPQYDSLR